MLLYVYLSNSGERIPCFVYRGFFSLMLPYVKDSSGFYYSNQRCLNAILNAKKPGRSGLF